MQATIRHSPLEILRSAEQLLAAIRELRELGEPCVVEACGLRAICRDRHLRRAASGPRASIAMSLSPIARSITLPSAATAITIGRDETRDERFTEAPRRFDHASLACLAVGSWLNNTPEMSGRSSVWMTTPMRGAAAHAHLLAIRERRLRVRRSREPSRSHRTGPRVERRARVAC